MLNASVYDAEKPQISSGVVKIAQLLACAIGFANANPIHLLQEPIAIRARPHLFMSVVVMFLYLLLLYLDDVFFVGLYCAHRRNARIVHFVACFSSVYPGHFECEDSRFALLLHTIAQQ